MRISYRQWTAALFLAILISAGSAPLFAQSEEPFVYKNGPEIVTTAESIVYEIVVTNAGTETLTNLFVYDFIPAGTAFLGADSGGYATTDGFVVWDALTDLPPGYEIHLTYAAAPLTPGTVVSNNYGFYYGDGDQVTGLWSLDTLVVDGDSGQNGATIIPDSGVNLTIADFTISWDEGGMYMDAVVANTGADYATGPFYVDVYIDPLQEVTGGKDWKQISSFVTPVQGLEWEVQGLGPGESTALTTHLADTGALMPLAQFSEWSGHLYAGTTRVVIYVDSWAENGSRNGLIAESNESDNGAVIEITDEVPTEPGQEPTPEPSIPAPGGDPKFETAIGFRPNPHGFSFANWMDSYDDTTDLDTATMIRLFGAENVCHGGTTAADCVLKAAARQWRETALVSARGGHCYGMAVAGQRFFAGLDQPGNYHPGAAWAWEMEPTASVRAHITEYFTTQGLQPADGSDSGWIRGSSYSPSDMLALIREQFQNHPTDPYVLTFYDVKQDNSVVGHAVTPYGIENRGGGIYWLHVYDNNAPGLMRYMEIDVNRETWVYHFATIQTETASRPWRGDARTGTLALRPTSDHLDGGWACPFCHGTAATGPTVGFALIGQGEMLIIDEQERAIGYDFQRNQRINQIDGAQVMHLIDGSGIPQPPAYRLPQSQSTTPYTVYLSGATMTEPVNADLHMTGPGFTVGLGAVQINPGEAMLLTMSPDGRRLSFTASETGTVTPNIYLALDSDAAGDSYIFSVGGFQLESLKQITVELDLEAGLLRFSDDDGNSDSYALEVMRIRADGTEEYFSTADVELGGDSDAALDFGGWDGDDMDIVIDGREETLDNAAGNNQVYLPYVTTH